MKTLKPPPKNPLEHKESFAITVLGASDEFFIIAEAVKLVGRRLLAKIPFPLSQDTCIRIDCDDSLILGHVLGCWHEGSANFVALEMKEVLLNASSFARMKSGLPAQAPAIRSAAA